MATFVLVHGAWSGAHSFRHVRRGLQGQGHDVFTPSLTGIGERRHLTGPQVGLSTHVADVVNQVLYEDLAAVVLLGFSYGGAVVTGCVEHIADRLRHLVYLDAFVPADGESVASLTGQPSVPIALEEPWLIPPPGRAFDDPDEAAFMTARRTPMPRGCFSEGVRLTRPLEDHAFERTFLRATKDPQDTPSAFEQASERARTSPRWHHREIDTGHMVASNRPDELVAILAGMV